MSINILGAETGARVFYTRTQGGGRGTPPTQPASCYACVP